MACHLLGEPPPPSPSSNVIYEQPPVGKTFIFPELDGNHYQSHHHNQYHPYPIEGGALFGGKAVRCHKRGGETAAETCSGGRRDHDVDGLRDHPVDGTAGIVAMVMQLLW